MFFNIDKVKEEKQDTFVEKLVTQVIKNLQVKISNIHIRYEDDVSTSAHCKLNLIYFLLVAFHIKRILVKFWKRHSFKNPTTKKPR